MMLELYVAPDGEGDFSTISEALLAVPYNKNATILIAEGIYEEKIFCEKKNITLIGAGANKTIIKWHDHANKIHSDGRKYGTFRTYTAFFGGRVVTVKDLSILNTAIDNDLKDSAIAAYVDTEIANFTNVHLGSHQNTLFCAPLPDIEQEKGEFLGPRSHTARHASFQFYHNCKITGNMDFVFGGGDVLFHACELISKPSNQDSVSCVATPSGKTDGAGFVFTDCHFISKACPKGSVFLARPWREKAKVALLNCYLDTHINEVGFTVGDFKNSAKIADSTEENEQTTFIEHESYGPGANKSRRIHWVKQLDSEASKQLNMRIEAATKAWGLEK